MTDGNRGPTGLQEDCRLTQRRQAAQAAGEGCEGHAHIQQGAPHLDALQQPRVADVLPVLAQ